MYITSITTTPSVGDPTYHAAEDSVLRLSSVEENDLPVLHGWFSDMSEIHLWTTFRHPMSFEEFVVDTKLRMKNSVLMVFRPGGSDSPIGVLQLHDVDVANGTASYVIYLAKEWRRAGYFHLATHEADLFALRSYPLKRIYLDVYEFNEIPSALMRAAGYREHGRLRKHIWWRDRYWDMAKYSCSREDLHSFLVRMLGPWADGLGEDAPEGFTRAEAQRLDMAICTAVARSGRAPADRPEPAPSDEAHQDEQAWPHDVTDYTSLVDSMKADYAREEGFPGFADWDRCQWRAFLVPTSHTLYAARSSDGALLAGLACRDETFENEPATRVWSLASDLGLSIEERDQVERQLFAQCVQEAIDRGRSTIFVYVQKDTARADRIARLFGEAPQPLPFGGTMIAVSDAKTLAQKLANELGAGGQSEKG